MLKIYSDLMQLKAMFKRYIVKEVVLWPVNHWLKMISIVKL